MIVRRRALFIVGAGSAFGVLTSWLNQHSQVMVHPDLSSATLRVASLAFGIGWPWAALESALGYFAPTARRAYVQAFVGAMTAVVAYYAADILQGEYVADDGGIRWEVAVGDTMIWGTAALITSAIFGIGGWGMHRADLLGWACRCLIPVAAFCETEVRGGSKLRNLDPFEYATFRGFQVIAVLALLLNTWFSWRRHRNHRRSEHSLTNNVSCNA